MVEKTAAPMKADPVHPGTVRILAGEGEQDGNRRAQGRDLGEREVDEDHPPLHHVDAQVGVDAGQDEAGRERGGEELQDVGVHGA
jgi:hypothetical protein